MHVWMYAGTYDCHGWCMCTPPPHHPTIGACSRAGILPRRGARIHGSHPHPPPPALA
jgi:hypothetical protein